MSNTNNTDARLAIENNSFHLVTIGTDKIIVNEESEAIDELRGNALDSEEDVSVVEVTVEGEDWQIKELPWRQIALQLLGDGGEL